MSQEFRVVAGQAEGQTMAEYAVVLGVITIAIVTTIGALSDGIRGLLERVVGLFS